MSEVSKDTSIGIGLREGTYYIAVEPPLNVDETVALAEMGTLFRSEVELVGSDPGCSFIEVDGGEDMAMLRIMDVMRTLMDHRDVDVHAYAAVVELTNPGDTPFSH